MEETRIKEEDFENLAKQMDALTRSLRSTRIPTCPHHGYRYYDVRRAGVCLNDHTLHLDPLPLLMEDGLVKVALE